MVYIKLENDWDKFMQNFNIDLPKTMQKLIFKSKCRKGKFVIQKVENIEYIIIPEINDRLLNKLKIFANIRCWKNICVSDNLLENDSFLTFASKNALKIMDGRWLFKNISDQLVEFLAKANNETLENREISILCNQLDETIIEKIKEICQKVKKCNILTSDVKQYKKMETEIYDKYGVILNISTNYKKALLKSSIIINFDFSKRELEKRCIFAQNSTFINIKENTTLTKKYWNGQNITFYNIDIPKKYLMYKKKLGGFNQTILYESLIYKNHIFHT